MAAVCLSREKDTFCRHPKFLEGFGVIGSYSKTKSNLNPTDNSGEEIRIPGLSGTVYNLTGYFEKYGFQARISYRYRSPFKGEVVQLFTNRGFTQILADKQVDAQVGYDFAETSDLKGFGVLFQVYNLTNSPYRTRIGLDHTPQHELDLSSSTEQLRPNDAAQFREQHAEPRLMVRGRILAVDGDQQLVAVDPADTLQDEVRKEQLSLGARECLLHPLTFEGHPEPATELDSRLGRH